MSRFDDPDALPAEDLVECLGCHTQVPKDRLTRVGGRMLCPGCAAAWFDEDEDEDADEKER